MKLHKELPSLWSVWWRAIDRCSLISILVLMAGGVWLIMTASPAIALQHHWSPFVLLKRHFFILGPGLILLLATSFCNKNLLFKIACILGGFMWLGLWGVIYLGAEIKGAKRWLPLGGFSIQPSEFFKPAFALISAYILSMQSERKFAWATIALFVAILPLFLQPDLGMAFLISAAWFGQCFVAGLPWIWTLSSFFSAAVGGIAVYLCFPHAAHRIQSFISGEGQDPFGSHYQILQALKSFAAGGLLGKGPGAGTILNTLPDGHSDFVFAVAGEELGLVACLIILGLYGLILFRNLWYAFQETDMFHTLGVVGLALQFGLQTILNIASVLHLIPTKGITLPFMSYGGSSFLSLCFSMGMMLALTRRYRGLI